MILLLILFLIVVPFLTGKPVRKVLDSKRHGITDTYICGVMTMLVASGVLHVAVMLLNRPFSDYVKLYSLILAALSLLGAVCVILGARRGNTWVHLKERFLRVARGFAANRETRIFLGLFVVVFLLCGVRIIFGTVDVTGDFTLETIRTTLETDSIYGYNSLTGRLLEEGMPIRQQILTMPFFLAYLCEMFSVAAGTLLYKIIPCYLLVLAALVYTKWAGVLFEKQREKQLLFLVVTGILLLMGDSTRFAPAALLLHQGFTGNAWCAGFVVPYAIYACMDKKWLLTGLCVGAELFLVWTTYGLGYCVLITALFGGLELARRLAKK